MLSLHLTCGNEQSPEELVVAVTLPVPEASTSGACSSSPFSACLSSSPSIFPIPPTSPLSLNLISPLLARSNDDTLAAGGASDVRCCCSLPN